MPIDPFSELGVSRRRVREARKAAGLPPDGPPITPVKPPRAPRRPRMTAEEKHYARMVIRALMELAMIR